MIRRGRSSAATSASSVFAPVNFALGMIAQEGVGPLRLEVPDRDGEPVLLDVERQVAPHRPQSDDAERAATHADISRAATSACSKARSRVRTPSSSPISDGERAVAERHDRGSRSSPRLSTAASRQARCGVTSSAIVSRLAGQLDAAPAASAPSPATSRELDRDRGRPAEPRLQPARRTGAPPNGSRRVDLEALQRCGVALHLRQIEQVRERRAPARQRRSSAGR